MKFTDSIHCRSRAHCRTCRFDPAWRAKIGAPQICPWGMAPPPMNLAPLGGCKGCGTDETPAEMQARIMGLDGRSQQPIANSQ